MTRLKDYLEYLFAESYIETAKKVLTVRKTSGDFYEFKLLKDEKTRIKFKDELLRRILFKEKDVSKLLIHEYEKEDALQRYQFFARFVTIEIPEYIEKYKENFSNTKFTQLYEEHIFKLLSPG